MIRGTHLVTRREKTGRPDPPDRPAGHGQAGRRPRLGPGQHDWPSGPPGHRTCPAKRAGPGNQRTAGIRPVSTSVGGSYEMISQCPHTADQNPAASRPLTTATARRSRRPTPRVLQEGYEVARGCDAASGGSRARHRRSSWLPLAVVGGSIQPRRGSRGGAVAATRYGERFHRMDDTRHRSTWPARLRRR
jgi:hypothetical protein